MNKQFRTYMVIILGIVICGAAFAYGAATAPHESTKSQVVTPTTKKVDLAAKLQQELPTITAVITAAYPLISTDYTINNGKLYGDGQWFGTTLTYKGTDTANRDTLRLLLQKKDGSWVLRTTPPQPILSAKAFPDVPKDILQAINQPISLPAGSESSPEINVGE